MISIAYILFTGLPKSCVDYKSTTGTTKDGEYVLYPKFPSCEQGVSVYCADMDTDCPKEYITLKAGRCKNYALADYRIGAKANDKTKKSSKTEFEKVIS